MHGKVPRCVIVMSIAVVAIVVAAVVELYDEFVLSDCVGLNCSIAYAYQKTWTKVYYDDSARVIVSHTGNHDIRSGGAYSFYIISHAHPYFYGCIGDPWSGYDWMRIDYDYVKWTTAGSGDTRWWTQSTVTVDVC